MSIRPAVNISYYAHRPHRTRACRTRAAATASQRLGRADRLNTRGPLRLSISLVASRRPTLRFHRMQTVQPVVVVAEVELLLCARLVERVIEAHRETTLARLAAARVDDVARIRYVAWRLALGALLLIPRGHPTAHRLGRSEPVQIDEWRGAEALGLPRAVELRLQRDELACNNRTQLAAVRRLGAPFEQRERRPTRRGKLDLAHSRPEAAAAAPQPRARHGCPLARRGRLERLLKRLPAAANLI
mmetsp:Transcript_12551/g.41309  ORF Transcript_12551/g.41309 Transcript_12551/m.41309 type:complete len:245 (+) Transcript_12551:40-774(+)